jgi:hypothetical protein
VKKSGITLLLCALLLAGCQLYWRKLGANLAAFTADHQTCVAKAGTDVAADQGLVNLHVYRAYLNVHGGDHTPPLRAPLRDAARTGRA